MNNPFFEAWQTPFGMPPFQDIQDDHFSDAFARGFSDHMAEIEAIANNPAPASFANTLVAFEASGQLLTKTADVFFNLVSTDTNKTLQVIEEAVSVQASNHNSNIFNHAGLFQRIKTLFNAQQSLALQPDQQLLLETIYNDFVRGGAELEPGARQQTREINEQLAALETRFGHNVLAETNDFELVLTSRDELRGLPESVLTAAANEAEARGHPSGSYAFSISRSSFTPFMQFADNRPLRQTLFEAYTRCGDLGNAADNNPIAVEIAALRHRRAKIKGFESHAHYMLEDRMAGHPGKVHQLLDQIWQPAQNKAQQEAADLQARIRQEGQNFELMPWDWWYYTEKIRSERFDLNETDIKPYFALEQVRNGAFEVARALFGIEFRPAPELPTYHPDVQSYEVIDADGTLIGIFLTDYFMRPSKRGGAWMSQFRGQSHLDSNIRPIIVNCCNFPKASPCLLGLDEVATLFHELGHGLHGLLSQVRYPSQAGTNVKQDFVELPSQIFEHWATEPEVLRRYAHHYETGEVIPDNLIEKILAASTFNQGFQTSEYLAAAYLDMAWHEQPIDALSDVNALENTEMARIGLPSTIVPRYKSTYFQHIFSGDDYSAGYYAYIWAEVLDADGFEAFKEHGLFDPATAQSFRKNILERGGSKDPMALYRAFRGRDPAVQALLASRGLDDAAAVR